MGNVTKDELIDAEMLARFAELKPEEVEDFRHAVAPGFVPEPWWDFDGQRIQDWKMWQEMQDLVRQTWDSGFPVNYTLSVLLNHASAATEPESLLATTDIYRALPYQRATMFMFNQNWRARSCHHCRKRFVAKKTNNQFCDDACRVEFRRQYKAAHIREKRKQNRQSRRKQSKRGGK
jgi:hypothetical protein